MAWHISFNPMFGIVAKAWDYRKWEELFWTMGCCLCGWVSSPSPSPPISPCSPSGSNISDSESRIHSFNARIVSILDGCRNPIKMSGGKKIRRESESGLCTCIFEIAKRLQPVIGGWRIAALVWDTDHAFICVVSPLIVVIFQSTWGSVMQYIIWGRG